MREKEIKEIFGKYLMDASGNEVEIAMAAALCETAKISLHQLLKSGQIKDSHLAIVELAIEAKCSLCVETYINLGEITGQVPGGSPEAFLNIYHKFNAIVQFLDSNLEDLKFGQLLRKDMVRKNLNQLVVLAHLKCEQLKSEGGGVSNADEARNISSLLNVAIQLILGEEIFGRFAKVTESIGLVLEKIKGEFVVPKSGNGRNKLKPN